MLILPDKDENKKIHNLTLLCTRGQELSSLNDLDSLLEHILLTASEVCETEGASVILMDKATNELFFRAATGQKSSELRKIRFPATQGIAGWIVQNRHHLIVDDVSKDPRHFKGVDKEVKYKTKNLVGVPILWEEEVLGVVEAINKKSGNFSEQDVEYMTILANQAGASLYVTHMLETLQNFYVNMLEILMMAAETMGANHGHAVKVARLATKIAREMGVTEREYRDIYYASLIHDIGQIKIAQDQIIGGERLIPTLGADMVRPIKMLRRIAEIIESHHELWDGSGHPKSLKGDEIPLPARIIGFAEAYEEYKEEEAYRKRFDPYYQDEFFRKVVKSHDPRVVKAFKRLRRKEHEKIAQDNEDIIPGLEAQIGITV